MRVYTDVDFDIDVRIYTWLDTWLHKCKLEHKITAMVDSRY